MAPFTALLYCYRLPELSPDQFREYVEHKHVPLVQSLLGSKHPLTHTRFYIGGSSKYVVGSSTSEDPDLIAVIEYEDESAMQQSMQARNADGTREKIQADEDKFMDRSRVKVIVLGTDSIGRTVKQNLDC